MPPSVSATGLDDLSTASKW